MVNGFEKTPSAFIGLFTGKKTRIIFSFSTMHKKHLNHIIVADIIIFTFFGGKIKVSIVVKYFYSNQARTQGKWL